MSTRIKLLSVTFLSGFFLMLVLCLGAQNLKDRQSINLGIAKTAPLPSGFIVGISIVIGVITGGCSSAVLIKTSKY